jgi:hypothetical protein|tara:strand:+ start:336 stop:626 length:291 start_codon:yes stop_codon:yes gene_type:complete
MGINKTIEHYWRSWAGLIYLFICLVDFFIAPLVWNLMMADYCNTHDCVTEGVSRWEPLTLGAGAMFHLSFGAILGATAWKKKEELEVHHTNRSDTV